jgi:tripartite ATP-independent transporter DctP family solute receptor
MKRTDRITLVILLSFCFVGIMSPGTGYSAEKLVIKFSHNEAIGSIIDKATQEFKARLEAETKGEIEVQLFPAGQMGKTEQVAEMMKMGTLQMAIGSPANVSGIYPPLQIFDIPYMLPSSLDDVVKVINGRPAEMISAGLKKNNVLPLAFYTIGSKQYTCNSPIHKPEDFKGVKIRTMSSPTVMESFRVLGAQPVAIPYFETYTALQLGTVAGEENPLHAIEQMKFHEVQKYIIISNHAPFILLAYVNQKWFEGLPPDKQKAISDNIKGIIPVVTKGSIEDDHESLEKIKKYGKTEIIELTPESRKAFKEALMPVREKYIKTVGEEGAKLLALFDEEAAKYAK